MTKVSVRIESPIKLDGRIFAAGAHEVDAETAAVLEAAGALGSTGEAGATKDEPHVISMTAAQIDQFVTERAQILADTLVANAVERATAEITRERDEALARADAAEARLTTAQAVPAETASPAEGDAPKKTATSPKG